MNTEAISFRLCLLLTVGLALFSSTQTLRFAAAAFEAKRAHPPVIQMRHDVPECEGVTDVMENWDCTAKHSPKSISDDQAVAEKNLAFWLQVLMLGPPGILVAFYSLRWILTGRLRPLWIKSDTKEGSEQPVAGDQ